MLLVRTVVKASKIHGKGLFAGQNIKKGQAVWKFSPLVDKKFPMKTLLKLPKAEQKSVKYYSYLNYRNEYVLCGDNAKYMNSSDNPNTEDKVTFFDKILGNEGMTVASHDIKKGEELTSRYLKFDSKGRPKHI